MATVQLISTVSGQTANLADTLYVVGEDIMAQASGGLAISATNLANNRDFMIKGMVYGFFGGLEIGSSVNMVTGNDVTIAATGSMTSAHFEDNALTFYGFDSGIRNFGTMFGGDGGILLTGNDNVIRNAGMITGTTGPGIRIDGDDNRIINSGQINGTTGVEITSSTGENNTLVNAGKISGITNGYTAGGGMETVVNSGRIYGLLQLASGDDTYVNKGSGWVQGIIYGGDGNDTYRVNRADLKLTESSGGSSGARDRVYSSVTFELGANFEELVLTGRADIDGTGNTAGNYLQGNAGDNVLTGKAGTDSFFGGRGTDLMTGGADTDGFYFKPRADLEIIRDFTDGEDLLVLFTGSEIVSVADLIAHHARDVGNDLHIEGDGTTMIIRNFQKADLSAADFTV